MLCFYGFLSLVPEGKNNILYLMIWMKLQIKGSTGKYKNNFEKRKAKTVYILFKKMIDSIFCDRKSLLY